MPNWCSNTITIRGDKAKIKTIWDRAQDNWNDENSPFGLLEAISPIDKDNATRETIIEQWGTKWDVMPDGLEYLELDDNTAEISGWIDTAWSPPLEAFQGYSKNNPDVFLELYFFEPGMCFTGYWNTEGVLDESAIYEDDLDQIPTYLREHFNIDEMFETMD